MNLKIFIFNKKIISLVVVIALFFTSTGYGAGRANLRVPMGVRAERATEASNTHSEYGAGRKKLGKWIELVFKINGIDDLIGRMGLGEMMDLVDRRLIKAIFLVDDTWHRSIEKWHYINKLSLNEETTTKKVSECRHIEEDEDIDEEDLLSLKESLPDGFDFIELKQEIGRAILLKVLKVMQSIDESARILMIGKYAIESMIERYGIKNRDFQGKKVKSTEEKREELIRRITETEFKIVKGKIEESLLEYNFAEVSADALVFRHEYPYNEKVQGYLYSVNKDPEKILIKLLIAQFKEAFRTNDFEEADLILQELMSFALRPGINKLIKYLNNRIEKARKEYLEREAQFAANFEAQFRKALDAQGGDVQAAMKAVIKAHQGSWPVYDNISHIPRLTSPDIVWGGEDSEDMEDKINELRLPDELLEYLKRVQEKVKGYKQSGTLKGKAIAVCRNFDYYGGTTEGLFCEILNRMCMAVELFNNCTELLEDKGEDVERELEEDVKRDIYAWEILAQAYSREEENQITDEEIRDNIGRGETDSSIGDIVWQREIGSGI